MESPGTRRSRMLAGIGILACACSSPAATYHVAPGGDDGQSGTLARPFATLARGQTAASPGDTVYLRGGEYRFAGGTIGITLDKDGAPGRRIHYFAYPGETPVFNYRGLTGRVKGLVVSGSWLHLKGLEMKEVQQSPSMRAKENWCIYVDGGSHNVFEFLDLHHNMGPGYFHVSGRDNLVLNCDSHHNYDAYSYTNGSLNPGENADGFGSHDRTLLGTGNVFRGCRAWWNGDDGYDFIHAWAPVVVESSWAWNNGLKAGTDFPAGNGNGFKVGGFDLSNTMPPSPPQHICRSNLAFNNRAAGIFQNHHPVANFYYHNTAFRNGVNFDLLGRRGGSAVSLGILRNNLSFGDRHLSNHTSGSGVDAVANSWNLPVTLTEMDFLSLDTTGVGGPRRADGGMPDIAFMKLRPGSDLIDQGLDVKLPFHGSAPDLGAFEYGLNPTGMRIIRGAARNSPTTVIRYLLPGAYDAAGRHHEVGGNRGRSPR